MNELRIFEATIYSLIVFLFLILISGCAPQPGIPTDIQTTIPSFAITDSPSDSINSPTHSPPAISPNPKPVIEPNPTATLPMHPQHQVIVARAQADLADRLDVHIEAIHFSKLYPDEFPGGDLGCPDPKNPPKPQPSILSGQVIELNHQQTTYIYHAHRTQIAFCGPHP